MNKKVFTVDGIELAIKNPTADIRNKAKLAYNKAWKEAVDNGSMLQRSMEKEAERLGLWNSESRQKVEQVSNELRSLERKLRGGANSFTSKDEAKASALQMRELRSQLIEINRSKDELYPLTAESFADEARIRYIVSRCCVDNNTGNPYFKSYDDLVAQSDSPIVNEAMKNYFETMYEDIDDIQGSWYENEWLKNNNYVDEKFRLVDKNGRLVDTEGRLINEDGRYVLEDGSFCDKEQTPVDEKGNYIIEYKDFD